MRPVPRLLPLLLLVFALPTCSSGGGGGGLGTGTGIGGLPGVQPREGKWVGEAVAFQLRGGRILDVRPRGASCSGTDAVGEPCTRNLAGTDLPGPLVVTTGARFEGVLSSDRLAFFAIEGGVFTSAEEARGRFRYDASGCCKVEAAFTAYFERPFEARDVVSSKDTGGAGSTDSALGGGDPGLVPTGPCPDGSTRLPTGGCSPAGADPAQEAALNEVNRIRALVGLPPADAIPAINEAAQAHCDCYAANQDLYNTGAVGSHGEDPSREGCTADSFADRMRHFGYDGSPSHEVMSFTSDPLAAVHGWMETLYHRLPIVHPNTIHLGYGRSAAGSAGCDTMDFGSTHSPARADEILYPYDGQRGVAPSWDGLESPTPPLPEGRHYPSGPIITVTMPTGTGLIVDQAKLIRAEDGAEVEVMLVTPGDDPAGFLRTSAALYAVDPLDEETQYTVEMKGRKGGAAWERYWVFETGRLSARWKHE